MILALDNSHSQVSVALSTEDGACIRRDLPRASEKVLGLIIELLVKEDVRLEVLTALVVCRGPGSYTGVRSSMALMAGLSSALNIPLHAFSALSVALNNYLSDVSVEDRLSAVAGEEYEVVYHEDFSCCFRVQQQGVLEQSSDILPWEKCSSGGAHLVEHPGYIDASELLAAYLRGVVREKDSVFDALYGKAFEAKTLEDRGVAIDVSVELD